MAWRFSEIGPCIFTDVDLEQIVASLGFDGNTQFTNPSLTTTNAFHELAHYIQLLSSDLGLLIHHIRRKRLEAFCAFTRAFLDRYPPDQYIAPFVSMFDKVRRKNDADDPLVKLIDAFVDLEIELHELYRGDGQADFWVRSKTTKALNKIRHEKSQQESVKSVGRFIFILEFNDLTDAFLKVDTLFINQIHRDFSYGDVSLTTECIFEAYALIVETKVMETYGGLVRNDKAVNTCLKHLEQALGHILDTADLKFLLFSVLEFSLACRMSVMMIGEEKMDDAGLNPRERFLYCVESLKEPAKQAKLKKVFANGAKYAEVLSVVSDLPGWNKIENTFSRLRTLFHVWAKKGDFNYALAAERIALIRSANLFRIPLYDFMTYLQQFQKDKVGIVFLSGTSVLDLNKGFDRALADDICQWTLREHFLDSHLYSS